jgi:hypothetical protein
MAEQKRCYSLKGLQSFAKFAVNIGVWHGHTPNTAAKEQEGSCNICLQHEPEALT